jgi:transcriptional regulator with XRE-family HTH domain
MADLDAFYRVYLRNELGARKSRNPRYSVRSFARALGVDNGYLSKLLSGKLLLSLDLAERLVERLKLEGGDRRQFYLSAAEEQQCHALYLIDPTLTNCDPACEETNVLPAPRKRARAAARDARGGC